MKRSWKTTIGGAFVALGTTLMGIGVVPQLSGEPNKTLSAIALVGFVVSAIGQFFAHLFAADQTSVIDAIQKSGGDTSQLERPSIEDKQTVPTPKP